MTTTMVGSSTFQRLLEDLGFETRSYSGRGMDGEECLAVTVDGYATREWSIASSVLGMLAVTTDNPCRTLAELRGALEKLSIVFCHTKTDGLGTGAVVYWPGEAYAETAGRFERDDGLCGGCCGELDEDGNCDRCES
jgi:hypothetical protein